MNQVRRVHTTVDVSRRWCIIVITLRSDANQRTEFSYSKFIPTMIILRDTGKNMANEQAEYDKRVKPVCQAKGWFYRDVGLKYAKFFRLRAVPGKKVFLVDNLDAHIKDVFVRKMSKEANFYLKFLFPNCTAFMHPVDPNIAILMKNRAKQFFRNYCIQK